jgi:hypothetical protein
MRHSQFHCTGHVYLDLHCLIFKTYEHMINRINVTKCAISQGVWILSEETVCWIKYFQSSGGATESEVCYLHTAVLSPALLETGSPSICVVMEGVISPFHLVKCLPLNCGYYTCHRLACTRTLSSRIDILLSGDKAYTLKQSINSHVSSFIVRIEYIMAWCIKRTNFVVDRQ